MGDLSLHGLFNRLDCIEEYHNSRNLSDEDAAMVASVPQVKKRIAELLTDIGTDGLTANEKSKARIFLDAQIKSVESGTKGAELRRAKLQELLTKVQEAPVADDPMHVQR